MAEIYSLKVKLSATHIMPLKSLTEEHINSDINEDRS